MSSSTGAVLDGGVALLFAAQSPMDQAHALRTARNLERVADLATNIAEMVIYINKGEIVRHKLDH